MQEVMGQVAEAPAPESEAPATDPAKAVTPAAETETAAEETQSQAPRTFTQQEVDEIAQRERAKAERRARRDAQREIDRSIELARQLVPQQQSQQDDGKPQRAQYASDEDFFEALTDWKLEQRDAQARRQTAQANHRSLYDKTEAIYAQAEAIEGFEREAFDELPLTKPIVEALVESESPAKLMAFMASNPAEVERIAKLAPARQAAELGKLELRITSAQKVSKAPDPVSRVGARGNASNNDPASMNQAEHEAWMKKNGSRWVR